MADEIDTIIPALVRNLVFPAEIDSAGNIVRPEVEYKGMNYIGLIPILTQGIKELDSLVTDLASPPPAPMLASPADGSTDLPTNLIFNWHPSSRALTYRFILSTTPDASGIVEDITISDTTQEARRLVAGTTYYWLVIAKNQNGSSEPSEMWSFTTEPPMVAPVLISPENYAADVPVDGLVLKWHTSTAADFYDIHLFNSDGAIIVYHRAQDTSLNISGTLNYQQEYRWNVAAIRENEMAISEDWYFTTQFPPIPAIPVLVSPANGDSTVPVGYTALTWQSTYEATSYNVYISQSPDFDKVTVINAVDTFAAIKIVDYNQTIYWKVRACNDYGYGEFSEPWYFRTEPGFVQLAGQSVSELSDSVLKTNIDPITDAVALTNQLRGVFYDWDLTQHPELADSSRQIGLIAQEVQRVLPEVVKTDDQGYLYIDYNRLVPVLIEAVKEQQGTIEAQQAAIDSLKTSPCCNLALLDSILDILNNLPPGLLHGGDKNNAVDVPANIPQTIVELETIQAIILDQNVPNPFAESTVIAYSLPETVGEAMIVFADISGNVIKTVEITQRGKGELKVFAQNLSAGTYVYYLIADGQTVETRKMVRSK
ncbi:MAG: tail fiber domain-containing protein [Bacteroidetes bacterium]|nr:tail fiber domain-containing protein [Bacteroidota bacterium]MBU1717999.1 tail fiber domain-containing protein [Bacteroidota bacterium]